MPIDLSYEADGACVIFVGRGVVTGAEFIRANDEIYAPDALVQPSAAAPS